MDNFGVIDDFNQALQGLLQKVKCSVSVIGKVLSETDLKKDYLEYKSAVENIVSTDLKKCAHTDGVELKFK